MKLHVLGSSSSGNCYLLESEKECLILEAGISFKEVKKKLNFDVSKIVGLLVTHEHGDHAKYIKDYLNTGIPIVMSKGTASKTCGYFAECVESEEHVQLGSFSIFAFEVHHDAAEPLGFLITHHEFGTLVFLTDSYYCDFRFGQPNNILVECNYKQSILDDNFGGGKINKSLRDRTMKSHFELSNTKEFLRSNDSRFLKNVVLLHLSDRNSDARMFQQECQEVTNKPTYVAEPGLTINLDLVPF